LCTSSRQAWKLTCGKPTKRNTEVVARVMARLGQGEFRDKLLIHRKGCCAVTGCTLQPILRASHIKPWRVSNDFERLDTYNGLLLVPHLDAIFDEGLISFDEKGALMISAMLTEDNRKLFQLTSKKRVKVEERHLPYLLYHRNEVFIN
jgi:putative restriction endonuclease